MRKLGQAILVFGILLMVVSVGPAGANPNNQNDPAYWGDDCVKIEPVGTPTWTADADYRLVVLKYATVNQEFYDVEEGDVLATATGQDISHLIVCDGEVPPSTTTTTPTTSTTTTPATTTPTTITTTTTEPPSTTTIPDPSTTTTSITPTTTVTTSTSVPPTTVTVVTDPPPNPPTGVPTGNGGTLPNTGRDMLPMFIAGALLISCGGYLVRSSHS